MWRRNKRSLLAAGRWPKERSQAETAAKVLYQEAKAYLTLPLPTSTNRKFSIRNSKQNKQEQKSGCNSAPCCKRASSFPTGRLINSACFTILPAMERRLLAMRRYLSVNRPGEDAQLAAPL